MTEVLAGLRVAGAVRVRVPLRRPMVSAHGAWPVCDAWLVRVLGADGRAGVGEATLGPFATVADQAVLDARIRALVGSLVGDVLDVGGAVSADPMAGAVASALDGAALDLGAVLADRPRAEQITVNAMVGAEALHAAVAAARDATDAGFRTIKLKAGNEASTAELVERVTAVRAAVCGDVALRLDVNGAWDAPTALERLAALASAGLELVEQPVAPGPIEEVSAVMAELRRTTGVRLAADESVTSLAAARALLAAGAVDAVVVKPARVGGPRAALAIATEAGAAGVAVVISTLIETGVGLAAAAATAAMLEGGGADAAPMAHGLATGGLLAADLVGGRSVAVEGHVGVPAGPGLGVDAALDRAAVERFAVDRVGAWS